MPAPKLDRALVLHVAKLAALSVSDAEADRFAGELGRIVQHVEQLDTVDTAGIEPTAHLQLERVTLREDTAKDGVSHEDALDQAPRVEGGGFAVPAFVD